MGTLLAGIGAVWVLLAAGPRYRLRYGPTKEKQLSDGSWEVSLFLSGRGRRDITRNAFDDGESVALDLGVPIRELTGVVSSLPGRRIAPHRVEGTCLLVGPGLIGRREDLRFTIITGTEPVGLTCQAALIDVQIRRQFLTPLRRFHAFITLAAGVEALALELAFTLFAFYGAPVNFVLAVSLVVVSVLAFSIWSIVQRRGLFNPVNQPVDAAADTRPTGSPTTPRSTPPDAPESHPSTPLPPTGSRSGSRTPRSDQDPTRARSGSAPDSTTNPDAAPPSQD